MKGSDKFKETIQEYLEQRALNDELFATTYKKENKNIDDCINYILNTVKNSGCNGFADEEIYGMAVHYYDEDNIEVGNPLTNTQVVVNHVVELSEEEKAEAKQKAIDELIQQQKDKMKKKSIPVVEEKKVEQQSLF